MRVVRQRLRDRGIVDFTVAVPAVADDVDHNVAAEFRAILRGEPSDAHHGVGIFRVHVKHRNALPLGDVRCEARGMLLHRRRGKADEIVDDDVDRAADGVALQIGEVQCLGPDTLPGKCRVAMHDDRPNLIQRFARSIDDRTVRTVSRLFRARAAHRNWIDGFEMARIGNDVHVDRLPARRRVNAGRADVILHVARAEHAARIDIFKSRDDFVRRLARRVNHDVQPPAVAHRDHGIDRARFARGIQNRIEQRNQRGHAFERKALGAQIARL